ncbi:MAG: hypothetical protein ACI8PZ_000563 [Myxococcota bacterium]|jgi:hypothetical protein
MLISDHADVDADPDTSWDDPEIGLPPDKAMQVEVRHLHTQPPAAPLSSLVVVAVASFLASAIMASALTLVL